MHHLHDHHHRDYLDDHLDKIPIFSNLSVKEKFAIRGLLTEIEVASGFRLTRQGELGHEFFIVVSGSATVERDGVHIADIGPGDFLGALSLLDGGPQTVTVVSSSPMTIMVASPREFTSMLDLNPIIARQMLPALVHRIRTFANGAEHEMWR